MPRLILKHACDICGRQYDSSEAAIECENRGTRPFPYVPMQVVEFRLAPGMNPTPMIVVQSYGIDEDCDPHELPTRCVMIYRKQMLGEDAVSSLEHGEGQMFPSMLSPVAHTKCECPLCGSKNLRVDSGTYALDVSAIEARTVPDIERTRCLTCHAEYFTEAQLEQMREALWATTGT